MLHMFSYKILIIFVTNIFVKSIWTFSYVIKYPYTKLFQ